MSVYGGWRTAVIDNGNTASAEVDLGHIYDFLDVILPTLTAGTIKVQVAEVMGGTYQDLGDGIKTASTTGGYSDTFKLGGWQNIKIVSSGTQGSERSIKVRGWRY